METVVVQLTNHNALGLLQKLEEMHIIKLLLNNNEIEQNLSERFAGKLPSDVTDDLQRHVLQSRKEWSFSDKQKLL